MSLQIAVVDDIADDRRQMHMMIEEWFASDRDDITAYITEFASAEDFLMKGGLSGQYDIVFLDIRMEGQNGLEAAAKLRIARVATKVVFVTSESSYALDAYSVHPFDFLVKPFDRKRLGILLRDLLQEFASEEKILEIRVPFGTVNVPVSQIISIVSRGHTVEFKMENGNTVASSSTFAEIKKSMNPHKNFLDINRGILINMDRALFLQEGSVVMSNRVSYPLRVRDQASLIRTFTQYQIRHRMKGK